nr:MAG TPA: hypothetical protein [Caudoviricetes sp.]DAU02171.1 MAG TPA: hypothetical protein [Caudoviricetes sp.]
MFITKIITHVLPPFLILLCVTIIRLNRKKNKI